MKLLLLKKRYLLVIILLVTLQPLLTVAKGHEIQLNTVAVVYFSPYGGCTQAIVSELDRAKTEVLIQAYSFTNDAIANALIRAHTRGVKVQIIIDKKQKWAKGSVADYERRAGIPIYVDHTHGAAHNKIMILDGAIVITGSFNFTKAAEEKNSENLLIIRSSELAKLYIENWCKHRSHSDCYDGKK